MVSIIALETSQWGTFLKASAGILAASGFTSEVAAPALAARTAQGETFEHRTFKQRVEFASVHIP